MRAIPFVLAAMLLPFSSLAEAQGLGSRHEQYGLNGTPKEKACREEAIKASRAYSGWESGGGRNIAAAENTFIANYDKCMSQPEK